MFDNLFFPQWTGRLRTRRLPVGSAARLLMEDVKRGQMIVSDRRKARRALSAEYGVTTGRQWRLLKKALRREYKANA